MKRTPTSSSESITGKVFRDLGDRFGLRGDFREAKPYGSGHINDTFAVTYSQAGSAVRYIFQRINQKIFRDIPGLMGNIHRVTEHQQNVLRAQGCSDRSRRALTLLRSRDGATFLDDEENSPWRAYLFIEGASTQDRVEDPAHARAAAAAFARFQHTLADLPGEPLHETIPDFHNTPKRFRDLQEAVSADSDNRARDAAAEIAYYQSHVQDYARITEGLTRGEYSLRTTHNDTKVNNVMIDHHTGEGICVIDLDTVMPGSPLFDFGDMVRTATNAAVEDEPDRTRVAMRLPYFAALVDGYLTEADSFLLPAERALLPFAGLLITREIGMRFLTDHLAGDRYFKTQYPGHNLTRARNQISLAMSMENQRKEMERIVSDWRPRCVS